MTEAEYLELCRSKYREINKLTELKDFYEYEKQFAGIMTALNREILQKNLSEVPADRRKKKHSADTGQ